MTRLLSLAAGAAFVVCLHPAIAAEVTETVMTTASPAKVWSAIGPFDAIGSWLPGVASSPADKGDKPGSIRLITLKAPGDPTVKERLTAHSGHSYSYKILEVDPKVLPVADYTSTLSVKPAHGGSLVTWHGHFQPAGGADDAASEKAVGGLYRAGLDNIKTMTEQ